MGRTVQRFGKTTRWFHWTFAASFLALAASGSALALREALDLGPGGVARAVDVHLGAAVALLVLPALVVLSGQTRDTVAELRGILRWSRQDLRWLAVQPLAAVGRASLPPAGKLNAGQKLNGVATAGFATCLVATGVWMWIRPGSLLAWFVHVGVFVSWIPLFAGHLALALLIPSTRPALRGMVLGQVDREWAAHHHPRWVASDAAAKNRSPGCRQRGADTPPVGAPAALRVPDERV